MKLTKKACLAYLFALAFLIVPLVASYSANARIEFVLTERENMDSPEISSGGWAGYNADNAGKWLQLDAGLSADAATATPSGDNKSLGANLAYGYQVFAKDYSSSNKLGEHDGIYFTIWAERAFDLVILLEFYDNGNFFGREVLGTVVEVQEGWKTYHIANSAFRSATSMGGSYNWDLEAQNYLFSGMNQSNPDAYLARVQFQAPRGAVPANLVSSTGETLEGELNGANPDGTAVIFKIDSIGVYDEVEVYDPPKQNEENYKPLDTLSNPQYGHTWAAWSNDFAGEWGVLRCAPRGSSSDWLMAASADMFDSTSYTPWGDNKSMAVNMLVCDLETQSMSSISRDFSTSNILDKNASGFYLTMNSDKEATIAFCVTVMNQQPGAISKKSDFYCLIPVQPGWHTYYIPYTSLVWSSAMLGGSPVTVYPQNPWRLRESNGRGQHFTQNDFLARIQLINAGWDDARDSVAWIDGTISEGVVEPVQAVTVAIDEIGYYYGIAPNGYMVEGYGPDLEPDPNIPDDTDETEPSGTEPDGSGTDEPEAGNTEQDETGITVTEPAKSETSGAQTTKTETGSTVPVDAPDTGYGFIPGWAIVTLMASIMFVLCLKKKATL